MDGQAINWQDYGKPDFATCGQWFYRLDPDLREGLNRSQEKVLIWTLFFCWFQGFHAGRVTSYASFSQTWLGGKLGRSRWTVARALAVLIARSLVVVRHRRPTSAGVYQTNLMQMSPHLIAALRLVRSKSVKLLRVAKLPHKDLREDTISKGAASLSAPPPLAGEKEWKPDPTTARLAFTKLKEDIRKQLERQ